MRWLAILFVAACGDGSSVCHGVGDAAPGAATIHVGAQSFSYGEFRWGANNDCPASGSTIISVTISGSQTSPEAAGFGIGLCLPRPDRIGAAPISLADTSLVQIVGANGSAGGCVVAPTFAASPTGTVTFAGFCTTAGDSFTMTLAGSLAGTRTCADAGTPESVTLALAGTALVTPR